MNAPTLTAPEEIDLEFSLWWNQAQPLTAIMAIQTEQRLTRQQTAEIKRAIQSAFVSAYARGIAAYIAAHVEPPPVLRDQVAERAAADSLNKHFNTENVTLPSVLDAAEELAAQADEAHEKMLDVKEHHDDPGTVT